MREPIIQREEACRLAILAFVWLAVLAIAPAAPFPVIWASFWPPVLGSVLLLAIWGVYRFAKPNPGLAVTCLVTAELTLFSLGTTLLNYMGYTFQRPFMDASLAGFDAWLGFDWTSYVAWVQAVPGADFVLTFAYEASLPQIVVIVLVLGLGGRRAELDRFSIAFMVGALTTVLFWIAWPSYGAFHHRVDLGLPVPEQNLSVTTAYSHYLLGLEAGNFVPLRFGELKGLIGFPSFHTVLALLSTWAVWRVRYLGPIIAVLNALVLLAIPGDGGHFLVDIAGGVGVTAFAIMVARVVTRPAMLQSPVTVSSALPAAGS